MKKLNLVMLAALASSSMVVPGFDRSDLVKVGAAALVAFGTYRCGRKVEQNAWVDSAGKGGINVKGLQYNVSAQQ